MINHRRNMYWYYLLITGLLLIGMTAKSNAQNTTEKSKKEKDIYSDEFIIDIMKKACDYSLDAQEKKLATDKKDINFEWIRGAFYTGVMALYEASGDKKYLDSARKWGEGKNWQLDIPDTRHADWQCIGQVYLELYLMDKDPKMLQGIKSNIDLQMSSPKPGRVDWWWCDSLYMAPPVYTRMYEATGDKKYLEFLNTMYWDTYEYLYDKDEHLFFRDKNYFEAKTKDGKKVFWSRGNGWVHAGLARLIKYLPDEDPGREKFVTLFKDMSKKIAEIQPADGLWGPSLLAYDDYRTSETSGSAFFTFALAWGVNNGYLDKEKYEPVIKKGWAGLVKAITPEGKLSYVQAVAAAPGPVKSEDTREYAVGAFMLAGNEIIKMMQTQKKTSMIKKEHPYIFANKTIIDRAKDRVKKNDWAKASFENIKKDADKILGEKLEIPSVGGQWNHHYVCKKCGTRLSYKDKKHICSNCKEEYTGWPYDEVIAGRKHRNNMKDVETLGIAYALTDDEKYAKKASEILLGYADIYTNFPYHDYKNGSMKRGARMLAQTLDESVTILDPVNGYDLIASSKSLTDADREKIENRFFREVAKTILRNDMGVSNWQSWHNAALTAIGYCLNDEDMVKNAIDGKSGFRFQMKHSILDDGFWYEGSPSYHFYALDALHYTAEAAMNNGTDLISDSRYHSMFEAPTNYIFPDRKFPAVNDSDVFTIDEWHAIYEIAYSRYKDPKYGLLAKLGNRKSTNALFYGEDTLPESKDNEKTAAEQISDFHSIGVAMLRQGETTSDTLCAHVHYGPHGGAHGHPDKLALILYGDGREILMDAGRCAYASPLYTAWYKTTLAHNTMIIDEKNQKPTQVDVISFNKAENLSAFQAFCTTAYPGVMLRRTAAITPEYMLDIFTAESDTSHTYDLAYHINGNIKPGKKMTKEDFSKKNFGYQVLKDVYSEEVNGEWKIDVKSKGKQETRLIMAESKEPTKIILAEGKMDDPPKACPVVLLRRSGNSANYVNVIETDSKNSNINSIKTEEVKKGEENTLIVKVEGNFGIDTFEIKLPKIEIDLTTADRKPEDQVPASANENFISLKRESVK